MADRYAIYLLPEEASALWRFGQAWLSAPEREELRREARVYGFHATLKAPFRLRDGKSVEALSQGLADFAAHHDAFEMKPCTASLAQGFLALRPERDPRLMNLAEALVREFDDFRAPMAEEERAKRLKSGLSDRQITHLDRWGYPYVMEDFHPHFTLTRRVSEEEGARAMALIPQEVLNEPLAVGSVCLLRQPEGGNFSLLRRFQLQKIRAKSPAIL